MSAGHDRGSENNFIPDYGAIRLSSPAGSGSVSTQGPPTRRVHHALIDSLLVKVTAWAPSAEETIARMHRALWRFLSGRGDQPAILDRDHASAFERAEYTTRFIDETPELFRYPRKRDRPRGCCLHREVIVKAPGGERQGRAVAHRSPVRRGCRPASPARTPSVSRSSAAKVRAVLLEQQAVLLTDTTLRDAHQSLLATRFRTRDMLAIAPHYARLLPGLFSVECWGGATFDVALRFLKECPWERLIAFRAAMPNLLLQMLLRSANGVGYTNYPDNVVRYFVSQAAAHGVDLFRVFDSLNWVENMRVAIDAVGESGRLCEAAICYTGNLDDPGETKYDLAYYVRLAKELERAGAHVLGIKDMAGLCRPRSAYRLVKALKEEIGLPVHFHTHDTSGIAAASVLMAIDAGVDAVDGALDSMSGMTSQPNLGSIVEALRFGPRDPVLDPGQLRVLSNYFEQVRHGYAHFDRRCAPALPRCTARCPRTVHQPARAGAVASASTIRAGTSANAYSHVNMMFAT